MPPSHVTIVNQVIGIPFHDLVEDLARAGVHVTVMSGKDLPPHLRDRDGIALVKGPGYDRSSFASRARTWLRFTVWALAELVARRPEGPVLIVSNPPTALWLAGPLRWLLGREVLLLIYDVYPDAIVMLEHLGARHPVVLTWRLMNRMAFAAARHVVTIGPTMAERVARQAPEAVDRIVVIENWADVERLVPVARQDNTFARAHGIDDTLNVMYSGNLGATRGLELLLHAADRLRDTAGIRFVIVGEGSDAERVKGRVRSDRLDNVLILPFQPDHVFPQSQAAADVSVITLDPRCDGISVPSKLYSALATGSAILAISSGRNEVSETIAEHRCGVNVSPDDGDGLVAAILRYHGDRALLDEARSNARRAAVERFSREVVVGRYEALLAGMAGRTSATRAANRAAPSTEW